MRLGKGAAGGAVASAIAAKGSEPGAWAAPVSGEREAVVEHGWAVGCGNSDQGQRRFQRWNVQACLAAAGLLAMLVELARDHRVDASGGARHPGSEPGSD
jgi:hypothetical protein